MDDMAVEISLDYWEGLVGGFFGDLVHSECHIVDVKDSVTKSY